MIPFFLEKRKSGVLPITHEGMTRFNISLDEGVDLVLHAYEHALGGEIFVPKIPSYKILELADAVGPNCTKDIVGIRPGEKIHEEMITESDSYYTADVGKYYVILPQNPAWHYDDYFVKKNAKRVRDGFTYNSGSNEEWLTKEQLRELIRIHIDPNFIP